MVISRNGAAPACVVVDLNTQADFLLPQGACLVANAEELIPAIRHIVAWTKRNHVPVISSLNSQRETEIECDSTVRCCVDGTSGQRKLVFTLMGTSVRVEGDNTLSVPIDLFKRYQQVIFRQRTKDLFSNPKADRFLTQLRPGRFILYGVALETAVKSLALGLLSRNRAVTVVSDACGYWSRVEANLALRQMAAKGVKVVTVRDLLREKLPRKHRYPHRSPANGNGNGNGANRRTCRNHPNGAGRVGDRRRSPT
jgi:nicotinamidase-related amidase